MADPPARYFCPAPSSLVPTDGSLPFYSSLLPPRLLYLSPQLSPSPPQPCRYLLPLCPWFPPLLPYPHLHCSLGFCICLRRPTLLLPRPRLPISPVRTKISVTRQAGVRHSIGLKAGPRRAGSVLAGPLPWWGAASSVLCSCNTPSSSTLCAVGRHSGICTPWRTGLWWSRLSAGGICNTAQPALGPV